MKRKPLTRRRFIATSAAASATTIAAPFVHTAGAAGSLTMGLWDHWVPGANKAMTEICEAWAQKPSGRLNPARLPPQRRSCCLEWDIFRLL